MHINRYGEKISGKGREKLWEYLHTRRGSGKVWYAYSHPHNLARKDANIAG